MVKKIQSILTIFMMVVTLMPLQAGMSHVMAARGNWIDTADTSWYADPTATSFTIGTADQLAGLAKLVNDPTSPVDFTGKTIQLSSDIDLAGNDWTPIGINNMDFTLPFKGTFDGNSKKISNLSINPSTRSVGLFGFSDGSLIKDLTIENVAITATVYMRNIGSLAGHMQNSQVYNVHVIGNINIATGSSTAVGGLVGYLVGSYVSGSSVRASAGSLISGAQTVGGLIGESNRYFDENLNQNVFSSIEFSNTNVNIESDAGIAGGLVGYAYYMNVSQSYANGSVYAKSQSIGGFIGELSNMGSVDNSYSTGSVTLGIPNETYSFVGGFIGTNAGSVENAYSVGEVVLLNAKRRTDYVGGFVGESYESASVTNCYWDITTSLQDTSIKGTGMTTADMKDKSKFSGFGFNGTASIWTILSGSKKSYPFIRNNAQSPEPGLENIATMTWIDYKDTTFTSGTGTHTDPFIISSAEELAGLAYMVNIEGKYSTDNSIPTYFKLFTSATSVDNRLIDLVGYDWTPIGTSTHPFIGFFNGNFATIDNLTINTPDSDNVGLFGVTGFSTEFSDRQNSVENLYLTNVNVSGKNFVGALVGHASFIKTLYVKADGSVSGVENVGGLIGRTDAASPLEEIYNTVRNSGFSGDVAGTKYVGGLIGSTLRTAPRFSYAEVHITVPDKASEVGGLIGRAESSRIWQTYTRGTITGGNGLSRIGQLVGYHSYIIQKNLSSLELNLGTNLTDASGLVGFTGPGLNYASDNYAKTLTELKSSLAQFNTLNFAITDDLTKLNANYDNAGAAYNFFIKSGVDTPRLWFEVRTMSYPKPSWNGTGTLAQPYLISTVEQLKELAKFTNDGDGFEGKYFELSSSIDLSSIADWTPIGTTTSPFKGVFDGNGKIITGLNIPVQSDGSTIDNAGFFGVTGPTAKIFDLTLKDIDVNGRENVGGLVGKANGSDFKNISVEGHVYGTSQNIGGIIGNFASGTTDGNTGGNIERSRFSGKIETSREVLNVGGLIGLNVRGVNMCYAEVILLPGENSSNIGGLVGYNKEGDIIYSYAIGSMESKGSTYNVGGLAGYHENGILLGSILKSYSLMDFISADGDANFGGLVGKNAPDIDGLGLGIIDRSFFAGNFKGVSGSTIGGLIGLNNDSGSPTLSESISLADMQKLATFLAKNWSILNIKSHYGTDPKTNTTGTTAMWYIDENTDTPRLWYQHGPKQGSNNDSSNNNPTNNDSSNNNPTNNNTQKNTSNNSNTVIPTPAQIEYGATGLDGKINLGDLTGVKKLSFELKDQLNTVDASVKALLAESLKKNGLELIGDYALAIQMNLTFTDASTSAQTVSSKDLIGTLTLSIPVPSGVKASTLSVIRINSDGTYETVAAKLVDKDGKQFYEVETNQLTVYGLVSPLAAINEVVKTNTGLALFKNIAYGGIFLLAAWFFWFILFKRRSKNEDN